jgi:hypothetical protein
MKIKVNATMNAITWLVEIVEAKIPIAMYAAPIKKRPKYPLSIMPISGEPSAMIEIAKGKVKNTATAKNAKPAKYFPRMISISDIGMVKSNSIVPLLRSSLTSRMVIAGTKNTNTNGTVPNTSRSDDSLIINIWLEKYHPIISRKADMTIYATGE